MKKKILIFLFLSLIVVGCGKTTTSPRVEVQKLFNNYNSLSSDLLIQLDSVMSTEDLTDEQKLNYKDILKRQYEDLKYKINSEVISGENAIVNVDVEVYNLVKAMDDSDKYLEEHKEEFYVDDKFDSKKFWDYKLNKMKDINERVNYTMDISLTLIDGKWHLDELLEVNRQKIHGLYK